MGDCHIPFFFLNNRDQFAGPIATHDPSGRRSLVTFTVSVGSGGSGLRDLVVSSGS